MTGAARSVTILDTRMTRRRVLAGSAALALSGLIAACGQSAIATNHPLTATPTAAPTRIVVVSTPLPTASPIPQPTATAPSMVEFVWKAEHTLLHPGHLALDGRGDLYVTDDENQRIQKFDTTGQFVLAWGSKGNGTGQFLFRSAHQDHSSIAGIAADAQGVLYVCDSTERLQMFDTAGNFLGVWSVAGTPSNLPVIPSAVTVSMQGEVYIVDTNNNRIQVFTRSGGFLRAWGGTGAGNGQFSVPSGIATDRQGNAYVVDINNDRVQKFDRNGTFLAAWGTSGFDDSRFTGPSGITVDRNDDVYVADTNNHRIQKFTSAGRFVTKWGTQGTGDGEMRHPTDVAVDEQGNIYVVDDDNNRIEKFRPR